MPNHYLNQCWNIVNWTLRNKLQSEILIKFVHFHWWKCIWKGFPTKWQPFCLGLNVSKVSAIKRVLSSWLSLTCNNPVMNIPRFSECLTPVWSLYPCISFSRNILWKPWQWCILRPNYHLRKSRFSNTDILMVMTFATLGRIFTCMLLPKCVFAIDLRHKHKTSFGLWGKFITSLLDYAQGYISLDFWSRGILPHIMDYKFIECILLTFIHKHALQFNTWFGVTCY